ncbi:hypothetical protein QQ045_001002 [Rhodiola kirilowii]
MWLRGTDVSVENMHQGFTHIFESTFQSIEGVSEYIAHPAHVEFADKLLELDQRISTTSLLNIDSQPNMANAASGMAVNDDCKVRFMELKAKRTYRFIVYKIEEKSKEVIVEKLGEPA